MRTAAIRWKCFKSNHSGYQCSKKDCLWLHHHTAKTTRDIVTMAKIRCGYVTTCRIWRYGTLHPCHTYRHIWGHNPNRSSIRTELIGVTMHPHSLSTPKAILLGQIFFHEIMGPRDRFPLKILVWPTQTFSTKTPMVDQVIAQAQFPAVPGRTGVTPKLAEQWCWWHWSNYVLEHSREIARPASRMSPSHIHHLATVPTVLL